MKTITVQIGNSDDKLRQRHWSDFIHDVSIEIKRYEKKRHFTGFSDATATWQNACFVFDVEENNISYIRSSLSKMCGLYTQDSIALTIGDTEFVQQPYNN